jgi:hypothetical protein
VGAEVTGNFKSSTSDIRVTHHDGVITVGARGDHIDRHTRNLFNTLQITASALWQFDVVSHANGGLTPAWQRFVDRLAACDIFRAHGQMIDVLTVEFIPGAEQ